MTDKPMTLTEAVELFLAREAVREKLASELKAVEVELRPAKDRLKAHFRAKNIRTYKGIVYSLTTAKRLDTAKARQLLGDQAAQAEVDQTRESLKLAD